MRIPLLLATALMLSACTSYVWVKPMGDPSTFDYDDRDCVQQAWTIAAPLYHGEENSQLWSPSQTICPPNASPRSCRKMLSDHRMPSEDLNVGARKDIHRTCMQAKGWILQAVEDQ